MLLKRKSLTRQERLSKNSDLIKMFKFAKRVEFPGIKLLYYPNNFQWNRMAVILKKGFKSAVHRNYQKRIVRESYRNLKSILAIGWDIVFLLFPGTDSYSKRFSQINILLNKAGLFLNNEKV